MEKTNADVLSFKELKNLSDDEEIKSLLKETSLNLTLMTKKQQRNIAVKALYEDLIVYDLKSMGSYIPRNSGEVYSMLSDERLLPMLKIMFR